MAEYMQIKMNKTQTSDFCKKIRGHQNINKFVLLKLHHCATQKEKALLHCHFYSAEIVNHITSLVLILIIQIACGFCLLEMKADRLHVYDQDTVI